WEVGYPFADELDVAEMFLRILRDHGDPVPFGPYVIRRRSDSAAIGGIGFFGSPDEHGSVEFGFGLVPVVRGVGAHARRPVLDGDGDERPGRLARDTGTPHDGNQPEAELDG
ncbi:GNAT family N-acetyltransferase, partial [Rhizobium johnstonii]|uniref:GNAT family N-acetyltransferase n=1 Tax=Rhizobium johnstonii TaxID=3019933 RepID=UPI003F9793F6